MTEIPEQPKPTGQDLLYAAVKGVIHEFPITGPASAEIMTLVFAPPIERRREAWLNLLATAVRELQERVAGLTPEALSNDEAFVTTALHATQIAVRTHQKEKLDALRNAVVNSALAGAPDETIQQIFLNHVDSLTAWHLRVLGFLGNPSTVLNDRVEQVGSDVSPSMLEQSIPELGGQRLLCEQLVNDLAQRGLVSGGSPDSIGFNGEFVNRAPRITGMGAQFLRFITKQ